MSRFTPALVGLVALALLAAGVSPAAAAAPAQPAIPAPDWQHYVQGPSSSTVRPVSVLSTTGDVDNAAGAIGDGVATLTSEAPPAPPTWPSGTTAVGSSVAGSNTVNGQLRTYVAANAVDGNPATFWNDATIAAYPDVLTITSPTAVTLPGVTLLSSSDGVPQDYTVDTWSGTAWVHAATVTGNTELQHEVTFDAPVATTQVRITATKDQSTGSGEYTRVVELYPGLVEPHPAPSITLDFGKVVVGYTKIAFDGASAGNPGLKLAFSETKQYLTDRSDFTRSDNGASITQGTDQIAVPEAASTWTDARGCQDGSKVCADGLHGFRYLKITLDAVAADAPDTSPYGTVRIDDVSLDFTAFVGTPATYTGWFESSDDALNSYWYDAAYTNELGTDTFTSDSTEPRGADSPSLDDKLVLMDGAKRDRDPYVGDISVSGRTTYLTHDTAEAAENVLADLADHQRDDGWIPPASINSYTLPLFDYPLYWVTSSWDYLLYTGDTDYASAYYSNLQKVLDNFYPSMTDANGLLSRPSSYGDYAFLGRNGEVTYYNALYVQALSDAADYATALGHTDDAAKWTARAASVATAINAHLWDAKTGAYLDAAGTTRHGQDGNGYAILAGVASAKQATSALDYLASATSLPYGNSYMDQDSLPDGTTRVYAFTSYPDIQARFVSGQADSAIEEIKRLYGWMQKQDPGITDWEGVGANGSMYEGAFTSAAHGWSTGVVPALSNQLLGATPTGIGFSTWTVQPHPADVKWAQGQLPTPGGNALDVAWSNPGDGTFSLAVTAPAGTRGDIAVPVTNGSSSVVIDGHEVWNGTAHGDYTATLADGYVTLHGVTAGAHTVTVAPGFTASVVGGVAKILPGGTATGVVRVTNPGTATLTGVAAVLTVDGGLSTSPSVVSADAVAPGATVDLPFTVPIPAQTGPGDVTVTASLSGIIGGEVRTFTATSVVTTVSSAITVAAPTTTVAPGDSPQSATVSAVLTNAAASAITGRLVVAVPKDWPTPAPSAVVTVPAGGSVTASTTVAIPLTETAGAQAFTASFVAGGTTLASADGTFTTSVANPPAAFTDHVDLGDTGSDAASEGAHNVTGSPSSSTGNEAGLTRRYSGSGAAGDYFQFTMAVTPNKPFLIRGLETYDHAQVKSYDIYVNGQLVNSRLYSRTGTTAGTAIYQVLVSDTSLTSTGTVTIKMEYNAKGSYDPSLADVWTLPVPADSVAPSVTLDLSNAGNNGWYRAGATATLAAVDASSDVASVEYRIGDGDWLAYTQPVALPDGTTAFSYRATDAAGNTSPVASQSIRVDSVDPTVQAALSTHGHTVAFAQDAGSGVDHLEYSLDGGSWVDTVAALVAADPTPSAVLVRAVDVAGNTGPTVTLAPGTGRLAVTATAGPALIEASGLTAGATVPVTLGSTDLGSAAADAAGTVSLGTTVAAGAGTLVLALRTVTAPIVTGAVEVGSPLTASPGTWTLAADQLGFAYQWTADGSPIAGATSSTFSIPRELLGATVAVTVTATGPYADAATSAVSAANTVTLDGSTTVTNTAAPALSGPAVVGGTLSTGTGSWNLPSDALAFAYQWTSNGAPIPGATSSSYVVPAGLLGHTIGAVVTASIGGHAASSASTALATVTAANGTTELMSVARPAVAGSAVVGSALTAGTGSWNLPDDALTFSYRWVVDGVAVSGATGSTFVVPAAAFGKSVGVIVTASVTGGTAATSAGSATKRVTATSATTITVKSTSKRSTVTVKVTAPVTAKPAGTITVHYGSKSVKVKLSASKKGVIAVKLPRLKKGTYSIRADFAGSNGIAGSHSATKKLVVKKKQ